MSHQEFNLLLHKNFREGKGFKKIKKAENQSVKWN